MLAGGEHCSHLLSAVRLVSDQPGSHCDLLVRPASEGEIHVRVYAAFKLVRIIKANYNCLTSDICQANKFC